MRGWLKSEQQRRPAPPVSVAETCGLAVPAAWLNFFTRNIRSYTMSVGSIVLLIALAYSPVLKELIHALAPILRRKQRR
jgi:hypothetical protein